MHFEQDFSRLFSDVFLGEKVPRFVVFQVKPAKSVDLIGRLKATNISIANDRCRCGFCDARELAVDVILSKG